MRTTSFGNNGGRRFRWVPIASAVFAMACLSAVPAFAQCTLNGNPNSCDLTGATVTSSYVAPNGTVTHAGGTITNNGQINFNGAGGGTYMYLDSSTTLNGNGSGVLNLNNTANNGQTLIYGAGSAVLENFNNTIQGQGHVGDNYGIVLQNDSGGTVKANIGGQTLIIDAAGGTSNAGTMTAVSGGILQFNSYTVNNNPNATPTGGTIGTDATSSVYLNSTIIQGGTLNGNIYATGNSTLDGSTKGTLINSQTYTVNNGVLNYTAGTIQNNGAILLNGAGAGTYMYLNGNTTLTGGGTLTLANTSHNGQTLIYGAGSTVLENVDNTIQGEGHLGDTYGVTLQNDAGGTIQANLAGRTLIIDAFNGTTNNGIMTAVNGGILQFNGYTITNNNQITTDSGNGSQVNINGSTINGGTLNGNVHIIGNSTFGSLTNQGTVTVDNSIGLYTAGTIQNNGAILLNGAGSGTYMYLNGNTTLTGGGTLTLANSLHNAQTYIYGAGGTVLENVDNTIQGEGHLGDTYGVTLQNDAGGTIQANLAGRTLIIDAFNGTTNNGIMTAVNGGILQFNGYTITNNNQITTDSGNGSQVNINGSTINGGTLNGNVHIIGNSTFGSLTNKGTVTVDNNIGLYTAGTIQNNGTILLNGAGAATYMYLNGNTTLTGGGTFTLANSLHNAQTYIYGAGGTVLENVDNTIQGEGHLGATYGIGVTNDTGGTIIANVNGKTLQVDAANGFTNSGTLKATNGATLLVSSPFSSADFSAGTLQGGGTYVVNGTSLTQQSTLQINSFGTLGGEVHTVGANTTLTLIGGNGLGVNYANLVDANGLNSLSLTANAGNLNLEGGYSLNANPLNNFTNSGNVAIGDGSVLSVSLGRTYIQSGGETQVDGTLSADQVNINGGILAGGDGSTPGLITGSVQNGGTVQAGDNLNVPTDPPGDLHILGDYTQLNGADLIVDIAGSTPSQTSEVNVDGNVTLIGTDDLTISLLNGFDPVTSGQFLFLTYGGSLNSESFTLTNANVDPHGTFTVDYSIPHDVYLDFTATSATPEPTLYLPLGGLLAGLVWYRKAKKNRTPEVDTTIQ